MTSKPIVRLNKTKNSVVGETSIELRSSKGAVTPPAKGKKKKEARKELSEVREKTAEVIKEFFAALTEARSTSPEKEILSEAESLLKKYLLEAKNGPRPPKKKKSEEQKKQETIPHTLVEVRTTAVNAAEEQTPLITAPKLVWEENGYLTQESVLALRRFHPEVVLYSPQIPPNTGTVARLCAAMSARLHLIEPLGFKISDKELRRAGLDYWDQLEVAIHKDWAAFTALRPHRRFVFVETGGRQSPDSFSFKPGDILVFGAETKGIPQSIINDEIAAGRGHLVTIPMFHRGVRSINLANAVSIVLYSAVAQLRRGPEQCGKN